MLVIRQVDGEVHSEIRVFLVLFIHMHGADAQAFSHIPHDSMCARHIASHHIVLVLLAKRFLADN